MTDPVIRWTVRWLELLNARHPWDHNAHFHPWILRHLPAEAERVLDVGCGRGDLLARLRHHTARTDGIDPDAAMAYGAAMRFRDAPDVHVARRSLAEHAALPAPVSPYDAITMVASLHHMDLHDALTTAQQLLRRRTAFRVTLRWQKPAG